MVSSRLISFLDYPINSSASCRTLTELINVETPSEVSSSLTLSAPTLRPLEPPTLELLTNKLFNGTTSWEEDSSA